MVNNKKKLTIILFVGFLFVYFIGSFSKVPFGDSVDFVLNAERGTFINSTSTYAHFLYSNTLVLLTKALPFAEGREIARWLTIVSAALCVPILYKTCLLITKSNLASLTASIVFGLGFSFWKNAEIVEIYTFNLLIISLFFYLVILTILSKRYILIIYSAIILGISLFSHIQNVLIFPAFGVLILLIVPKKIKYISITILGALFLGLFIFPLKNNEPLSSVYSSGVVSEKISNTNILKSLLIAIGYLVYNFWYFLISSILGMFLLYKKNKLLFFFLTGSALPIFIFSIIFGVSDNYVYFIPFNYILAIFLGLGVSDVISLKLRQWLAKSVILIPAFYFLTYKIIIQIPQAENFAKSKSYKGGLKYYLLPWMNNNVGILEFTLDKKIPPEPVDWMTKSAEEYIYLLKIKGYTEKEIKEL
ncbi:glycosyltransferase family protein [Chryseobacterium mulctrae]|uniref:DUF2723 domain-containing protein n=1 Tax=Chryseobacterium mulctrae TaxID=2576777 RepID=UPI001117175C|nr:DUF2723 domain-containing protein [Chryseobacterium mulctrae]